MGCGNLPGARNAPLRFGGADEGVRPYTNKSPRSAGGGHISETRLEQDLQPKLHVEGFTGADAGGSVEVADGVSDRAATRICGS